MFSRLLSSASEKLSHAEAAFARTPKSPFPTLSFSDLPSTGKKTRSLCSRCLSLLSYVMMQFGDGTDYEGIAITHSASMTDLSEASRHKMLPTSKKPKQQKAESLREEELCMICIKTFILFEAARAHVAFESSLRAVAPREWELKWRVDGPEPQYPHLAPPHHYLTVALDVRHIRGYGWGIGSFKIYPNTSITTQTEFATFGDEPIITPLDDEPAQRMSSDLSDKAPDFSSTLSEGSVGLVSSWMRECAESHTMCNNIFGTDGSIHPSGSWFPDRLLRINATDDSEVFESGLISSDVTVRIVLKSDPEDFPPEMVSAGVVYFSLSHCWGLSPNPTAPLGGRADTVLTTTKLSSWQKEVPLRELPLTLQHAISACAIFGCKHIWIDSLCIVQDSFQDWKVQSAVMGDVYKHAWLNITALSSLSDYEGFINDSRDPRVVFGFRAPFGSLLTPHVQSKNGVGQECVLLHGVARLLWSSAPDIPGTTTLNAPLFQRAWVFQERSLSRRAIGFTSIGINWSCDQLSGSESPGGVNREGRQGGLRGMQHRNYESLKGLAAGLNNHMASVREQEQQALVRQLLENFDFQWHSAVTAYTLCKLTKPMDKLIAISSIARELAATPLMGKHMNYIAGLWTYNLIFQLGWITVEGANSPPKKRIHETGYVAPSWSWASIDVPVQPRFLVQRPGTIVALADVRARDVALETDFAFGFVKAGWIRMWGSLRRVKAARRTPAARSPSTMVNSLTDLATGEDLWFSSDTMEGIELIQRGKGPEKLLWTPLFLEWAAGCVQCKCLVLVEIEQEERAQAEGNFVKRNEKIYRRLGSGNFGQTPSTMRRNTLLTGLGAFADLEAEADKLLRGFKRSEDRFEEFVLI